MRHKLERDTKAWLDALPEDGRARYGRALQAMAISISQHAAHGSAPRRRRSRGGAYADQPAAADALSRRNRAKRLLFMRRVLPDRVLDRMVMRTVGLRSA